jgi:hypothetical protein
MDFGLYCSREKSVMELLRLLVLSVLILLVALWLQSLLDESQALDTGELPQDALELVLVNAQPVVWLPLSLPAVRLSLQVDEVEPYPLRSRPRPILD